MLKILRAAQVRSVLGKIQRSPLGLTFDMPRSINGRGKNTGYAFDDGPPPRYNGLCMGTMDPVQSTLQESKQAHTSDVQYSQS